MRPLTFTVLRCAKAYWWIYDSRWGYITHEDDLASAILKSRKRVREMDEDPDAMISLIYQRSVSEGPWTIQLD